MATPLNLLIVEDSQDDADLIVAELRRAGFAPSWKRVETEADFLAEINNSPDIILSDYSMPRFSGLRAVELLRTIGLNIPFILISGTVGEDTAVEAMKLGATDYLLKDRLARLGKAVEHALEQKRHRDDRGRMQQQLALQATALETAANGILITDRAGTILWVNAAFTTVTGYAAEEVLGKTPRVLKSGKHDQKFYHDFWQTILSGDTWRGEFINCRKDGSIYYDEHTVTPVRSQAGKITHFIGIMNDVTSRKQAEQALRESEEKFRQLAESVTQVFWLTDKDLTRILYVSPAYEKIWGRSCQSLYENPLSFAEAVHPEDRDRLHEMLARQKRGEESEAQYRIVQPNGSVRWIRDRSFPIRNQSGEVYRVGGVAADITDNRLLEEKFRQSQKMEAFGQLAGGVAHDFNNILAIIMLQAGMLRTESSHAPGASNYAREIGKAAERGANLTRQLLMFSRRQVLQPRDLDLNEIVANITKMLRRIVGEDIRMQLKYAANPMWVHADAGMLDQVLMNLTVNSRDAMPKGGDLLIETSAVELDEFATTQTPQARPGSFVRLSVTDTGGGISPDILPRIFEPFFTTKEVGKGTGLGLATVFGIVQQHQGWINVYSEIGLGTTFRVYLPRLAKAGGLMTGQSSETRICGGNETILLVEDEPDLRMLVRNSLAHLGYRVLEAATGTDAVEMWKRNRDEIQLLLTDVIMPGGMNGRELGQKLQQENPKLKIVYASGYGVEVAGTDLHLEEGVNFLRKPFEMHELAQILRTRLNARA